MTSQMALAELKQGTADWLAWRAQGIGASDAPIIMGISPYKTAHDLFLEKIGKKKSRGGSPAMNRGNELESAARSFYELKVGKEFLPELLEDDEHCFLRCSLDGRNGSEILEIKCPGLRSFVEYRENGIPAHHQAQIQHQLMISKAEVCNYWVYSGIGGFEYKIKPNQNLIKNIRDMEIAFWKKVQAKDWGA